MPTETECKIPVDSHEPVEKKLQHLRAEPHGEFVQDDRFFDTADRRLLQADQGLRLRSLVQPGRAGSTHQHVLTYKGARQESELKQREEIETGVADPEALIDILDRLGYSLMLHLQKRRRRYRLHDCWIELDTVPLLGRFVEVEGPTAAAVTKVARELGLDLSRGITDSYASLLVTHAKRRGLPEDQIRFLLPDHLHE